MAGSWWRRWRTTVWRARLSWRSPPRLSRWRIVWPLEAGSGATPASRAKAASERTRPGCDQVTISCAATIGPSPASSSSWGASARTCARISRSSSAASLSRPRSVARGCAGRGSSRARRCARARAAKRLQRWISRPAGSPRSCRGDRRGGHDHAAQLHERLPANLDRAAACEQQAAAEPRVAVPLSAG